VKFETVFGAEKRLLTMWFSMFSGDYLGEKKPFNEQVLKAFVELHDFTNLILVQALR
jgi:Sec7 domain